MADALLIFSPDKKAAAIRLLDSLHNEAFDLEPREVGDWATLADALAADQPPPSIRSRR
jgi:hypothetical protein